MYTDLILKEKVGLQKLSDWYRSEDAIFRLALFMDRLNKGGVSQQLTTRYRYIIKSVDGKEDTKSIVNFINNKFLSKDTRAFRNHLSDLQPDMDMVFEYDNPISGEKESNPIPMGIGFFYPTE